MPLRRVDAKVSRADLREVEAAAATEDFADPFWGHFAVVAGGAVEQHIADAPDDASPGPLIEVEPSAREAADRRDSGAEATSLAPGAVVHAFAVDT